MQNRPKRRLKIILIFILFVDFCSIKYGNCAPRNSQSVNDSQKVKRNAGFMNYLSSIIFSTLSNYHDSSWNFYDHQQPEPSYEANFIQYLDNSGNNVQDENYINWPEYDMNKINHFETVPKDVPIILPYGGKDDSIAYISENDCDFNSNSVENDLNWNIPQQGIDESIFHNFYLIPEEIDLRRESVPTTIDNPVEQSIQNQNEPEEEKPPNIKVFNCSPNLGQKEFVEKVLSSKNDEYMVLFIKINPFLGGKEQESQNEVVLQQPPGNRDELEQPWRNTTAQVDIATVEENKPNGDPLETTDKVENRIAETADQDLRYSFQQENSLGTSTSAVSTYTRTTAHEETDLTIQTNKDMTSNTTSSVTTEIDDKIDNGTELDLNLQEITYTESSITPDTLTVSAPIAIQDPVIKLSKIPTKEENENNVAIQSQAESNKQISNEESVDIQAVQNVENQIKVETVEKTMNINNVFEDKLEAIENPAIALDIELVKEHNLQTADGSPNTEAMAEKEILIQNNEEQEKQDSVNVVSSVISINDSKISEEFPTSTITSQIENDILQAEETSEGSLTSNILNPIEVSVNTESPALLEESFVSVTSTNVKGDEDEESFLRPVEVSSAIETSETQEDVVLLTNQENNFDSISKTTTNPVDILETTPSQLTDNLSQIQDI